MAFNQQKWCDMNSVRWKRSSVMEPDDISVSDNLLEFVKDEDLVKSLNTQDEILPQDIFNEIINEFDFGDPSVDMNTLTQDQCLTVTLDNNHQVLSNSGPSTLSPNEFYANMSDDPLLSSTNTNMNYNQLPIMSTTVMPSTLEEESTSTASQQIYASNNANLTANLIQPETTQVTTAVVYQIANSAVCSTPLTSPLSVQAHPSAQIVNNVTPIQLLVNPSDDTPTTTHKTQKYRKILDKNEANGNLKQIQLQPATNLNQLQQIVAFQNNCAHIEKANIDGNSSFIINPTVMYTTTTSGGSQKQNIHLIDGTTILTTHMPTIVVDPENQRKVQVDRVNTTVPKVKEVKKTTHNAIERRYRTSINDKIVELKNILVGFGGKLNKSAILKKSIDKIKDLENENDDLKMENERLRQMLRNSKLTTDSRTTNSTLKNLLLQKSQINQHKRRYTQSSTESSAEFGSVMDRMTPPPTSDESNPSLSPQHSDVISMPSSPLADEEITTEIIHESEPPPAKRTRRSTAKTATKRGMSTHSKVALCIFMFAIITINPLSHLLSSDGPIYQETMSTSRRTILAAESSTNFFYDLWQQITQSALVFAINFVILTICLIKLLVYGDPVMSSQSPVASDYLKQRQIADHEFNQGNGEAAFVAYEKCLQIFGVTLPQTWFDLITMTIWQFLRCCLHRLRFSQWLSSKSGGLFCSHETREDAMNSAQELATVLNRCNQIHLSQNMKGGYGLILSMYAVNMAEVTKNMSPLSLVDIYLTAALRCRRNYPYIVSWICSRYYLYKAKSMSSSLCDQELPSKYNWIFCNPYGYKFICRYWFENSNDPLDAMSNSMFAGSVNSLDPLSIVLRDYNMHLLKSALQCLIGVSCEGKKDIRSLPCNGATAINDVLNYAELLKENCDDLLTLWWVNLFSIDALWLLGEDASAEALFDSIENYPHALADCKDSLPSAVITVFKAKKMFVMRNTSNIPNILSQCNAASKYLEESLIYNRTMRNDMVLLVQLLVCDWLLETRTMCWEVEQSLECTDDDNNNCFWYNSVSSDVLEKFQNDLNSLYCVMDQSQIAKSRIYLYEAVFRLMAGAAPGQTQELLDRSAHEHYRRNTRSTFYCGSSTSTNNSNCNTDDNANNRLRCGHSGVFNTDGERERATAMYVACKYLPTPLLCLPGERAGMLAEAAKTLKKIGNRKKLKDCYQLMKSFGTTTVSNN